MSTLPSSPRPTHRAAKQGRDLPIHDRRLLGQPRDDRGALAVEQRPVEHALLREGEGEGKGVRGRDREACVGHRYRAAGDRGWRRRRWMAGLGRTSGP